MAYIDIIDSLIKQVHSELLDLSIPREHGRMPSQVSSEFLTNKEQGDWAEKTLLETINNNSQNYIAVKYGRADDIIAGDEKFPKFYEEYQKELDTIGKKPDILVFRKSDLSGKNFETLPDSEKDLLISKAKCGIEVRSSSFISEKYETQMRQKRNALIQTIQEQKNTILLQYAVLLQEKDPELFSTIKNISLENIHCISFIVPTWRSSRELSDLATHLKHLKNAIKDIQSKRFHLSITPKIEDLKVVYNWVKKYNVPHYYVQVFFDKAYGISLKTILELISNPANEGEKFYVEGDVKNQNKTVIKIQTITEKQILDQVEIPTHYSQMKELARGNLLFYVKFKRSPAKILKESFHELFGINL